jgi:2-hydroxyacyl-CoA lyase 1
MGMGPGSAIAAQVANPDKRVIALEGDAAFGFDGLEVEVAVRHKLPITWIVFNNLDCCDLPFSAEPYSIRSDLPTSVTPVEEDREWSCQS